MKENAATLWEIDALWLTLHSYFASTTGGFCRLRKAVGKKEYNFIEFYIL